MSEKSPFRWLATSAKTREQRALCSQVNDLRFARHSRDLPAGHSVAPTAIAGDSLLAGMENCRVFYGDAT